MEGNPYLELLLLVILIGMSMLPLFAIGMTGYMLYRFFRHFYLGRVRSLGKSLPTTDELKAAKTRNTVRPSASSFPPEYQPKHGGNPVAHH